MTKHCLRLDYSSTLSMRSRGLGSGHDPRAFFHCGSVSRNKSKNECILQLAIQIVWSHNHQVNREINYYEHNHNYRYKMLGAKIISNIACVILKIFRNLRNLLKSKIMKTVLIFDVTSY